MKSFSVVLSFFFLLAVGAAYANDRACEDVPASGDPGDQGDGLAVTIQLIAPDEAEMIWTLPVGVSCHTWSQSTGADHHSPESHFHFFATDQTSFARGTLRWTEYGPGQSQEAIDKRCFDREEGHTHYATTGDVCENRRGNLMKVVDVRGMGK